METLQTQNQPLKNGSIQTKAPAPKQELATIAPAVDVLESDKEIVVYADVPGVKSSDLDIEMEKDTLTFTAKRPDAGFVYKRAFVVPRDVDVESITAELTNGVLKLHLAKRVENRARTIPVRGS